MYGPRHEQPPSVCGHVSVNGDFLNVIHCKKWPSSACCFPKQKIPFKQPSTFILFDFAILIFFRNDKYLCCSSSGCYREPNRLNDDIIHIVTANPICLYTMNPKKQHLTCLDLYDIFPSSALHASNYKPRLQVAPLGFPLDGQVILHEEVVSTCLLIVQLWS